MHLKVGATWIERFTVQFCIFSFTHTNKRRSSPKKKKEVKVLIAAHLGTLYSLLMNGISDDDLINVDKSHFVMNVNDSHKLSFAGETEVKYAEVVSGRKFLRWGLGCLKGNMGAFKLLSLYFRIRTGFI